MILSPRAIKIAKAVTMVGGLGLNIIDAIVDDKILDDKVNKAIPQVIAKLAKTKKK